MQGKAGPSPFHCGQAGIREPAEAEVSLLPPRPLRTKVSSSHLGSRALLWLPHCSSGESRASLGQGQGQDQEGRHEQFQSRHLNGARLGHLHWK